MHTADEKGTVMSEENKSGGLMDTMLLAAFDDRESADRAVQALEEAGYEPTNISVITKDNKDQASEALADTTEGAVAGATTGGALGGLAGLLAGAGVFPALAGLFIGGPIAVALGLTGMAATAVSGVVTGAAAGGLIGALSGLGLEQDIAQEYEEVVNSGGVLLGVPQQEGAQDPRTILSEHGAASISEVALKQRA